MLRLEQALKRLSERRFDVALAELERLENDPEVGVQALGHRAYALKGLGRLEEALSAYSALCERLPDDAEAHALRGEVLRALGRTEEALLTGAHAIACDPKNGRAARLLVACHESQGSLPAAPLREGGTNDPVPLRALNPVIAALEAHERSYPASVVPEVGRFIYWLVRNVRPSLMLETGTHIGYSALCTAQAMEDNQQGHLHCFDIFASKPGYVSPVLGACEDQQLIAQGHLEAAGLAHRATLHKGPSAETIVRSFGADPQGLFDLAFIDGDHTLSGCLKDWEAVDRLLREGGLVLLHDTEPERCTWLGPRYLIEELPKRAPGRYQIIHLVTPEGAGMALLQKMSSLPTQRWRPPLSELLSQYYFDRLYLHPWLKRRAP